MAPSIRYLLGYILVSWCAASIAQAPDTPAATPASAPAPAPAASQPRNDYSKPETWLCRPGRKDACSVDISSTVVSARGKLKRERFKANAKAPIDCFYVYPTVSQDATGNSDMIAGPDEENVVRAQFARLASQCRTFAPLYRQFTLPALRSSMSGKPIAADRTLPYNDVTDAWNYYLQHDNAGRGVVLVGHSQGSLMLTRLIADQIDGKPIQSQLVSALLLGSNLAVPKDKDVGGTFKNIPLCRSSDQVGCTLAYASFRSSTPPPATSLFVKPPGEGMRVACVNPAALAGGSATLHSYLSNGGGTSTIPESKPWVTPERRIATPFVSVPGLLSAECITDERGSYLSVTVNADPNDPRTDDIAGDIVRDGKVAEDWGLHLVDANIAMGDLVSLVGQQAKAYAKQKK